MSTRSPHDLWPTVETPLGPQLTFAEPDLFPDKQIADYIASSNTPEWFTPKNLLADVYSVLGSVDLDPAAPPDPYTDWVKAKRHITELDGTSLAEVWKGKVFLNPPYGRKIGVWVGKLAELYKCQFVKEAILLVPARTDTQWFNDLWAASCLCFITGRLKFEGPNNKQNSAPFPSVLAYYGSQWHIFAHIFQRHGHIVWPSMKLR